MKKRRLLRGQKSFLYIKTSKIKKNIKKINEN